MDKFKVGDKIVFVENYGSHSKGDEVEVIAIWLDGNGVWFEGKNGTGAAFNNRFKLAESKITKNQRITALEKEIAELRTFKELAQEMEDNSFHDLERIEAIEGRLEHLEQAVQQYFAVPGEPSKVNEVSNIYHRLVVKNVKQLPEDEKLAQEKGLTCEDMELILSTFKLRDEKSPQAMAVASEENEKIFTEATDFEKLLSVLEAACDLGIIELPSYVFDLPDSYKERAFQIYQLLKDGNTTNAFAYAILNAVREAFDITKR